MAKRRPFTVKDPKCTPGKSVTFRAPAGASGNFVGTIIDCVFSQDDVGGWGTYRYFAELIDRPDGQRWIRLGYWRRKPNETEWGFGGQTTITAKPQILKKLLAAILSKPGWFDDDPAMQSEDTTVK